MKKQDKSQSSWWKKMWRKKEHGFQLEKKEDTLNPNLDKMKMREIPILDPATIMSLQQAEIQKRKEFNKKGQARKRQKKINKYLEKKKEESVLGNPPKVPKNMSKKDWLKYLQEGNKLYEKN